MVYHTHPLIENEICSFDYNLHPGKYGVVVVVTPVNVVVDIVHDVGCYHYYSCVFMLCGYR